MNTSSDAGREIPAFAGMRWGFGDVLAAMAASFTLHAPAASHMP